MNATSAVAPMPLPGPRGLPFFGQAFRYQKDPLGFFLWMRENYGDIASDANSRFRMAHIFSPEAIEHVLLKNARNYQKDRIVKSWDLLLGQGLLISEGELWKRDRRMMNPSFSRAKVLDYQACMLRHASACASDMALALPKGRFEVTRAMMQVTLKIALESLFGRSSLRELDEVSLRDVQAALKDVSNWFEFSSGPWLALPLLFPFLPFPKKLRYQKAVARLDQVVDRMVARKRKELAEGQLQDADLLAALLQSSDEESQATFTDAQVRDHALTFFLAGHETTSLALTYTLRLLAQHPDLQEQLRAELHAAGPTLTVEAIEPLELLSQVVDESLRLYPPVPTTAREALEEDVILGYRIEPKTTIIIPTWALHRDPRYFGAEVENFLPSRWTPAFRKNLPRSVFLPFGFGPRMCIGFRFAMQELKLILAMLLKHHRLSLPPDAAPLRLQMAITMRPKDEVWLNLEPVA